MEPDTNTQPIPPTIQQAPIQTQVPEKHNSPILLWLLILGVFGAASYFGYQNWQLKQQLSQIQPTPTPLITPATIPDPTASWKTYTYEKYDYSFKYPSEYAVEERAPGFLVITAPGEHAAQAGISIESRLTGPYANYANAKNVITSTNTLSETITADNWEIFQGIGKEGMLKGVEFRFGIAPYKTGAIETETLANTQYVKVFDQILSTFKFSNSTNTGTSDWKTYTNQNAAFSLQFPSKLSELTASEAVVSGPWEANPQLVVSFADKTTLVPGTDHPFDGFSIYEQEIMQLKMTPFSFDAYLNEEVKDVKQSERGIPDAQIVTQKTGNVSFSYIDSETNVRRYFILSQDKKRIMIISTATRSQQFLDLVNQIISTLRF